MSQQVKSITFEGKLEVWGVYNYNGAWSVLKTQKTKEGKEFYQNHRCSARTPKGRENHIYAKTFIDNEKKEIDYTSSRCLRHEMFKDIQPRQPSDKEFGTQFIKMVASEVGLLRGYMSPDEKGGNPDIKGLKRCSPLHIADAVTIKESYVNFDQGVSSKPKKEEEERKKQSSSTDDKKGTSLFSKDNLPYRQQKLLGGINLKELQFLSLYGIDNDFSMISEKDKDNFLKCLKEYFQRHDVDNNLEIKEYEDEGAIYKIKRTGILLSQEQIRHLIKVVFQRVMMINGLKAGSRLSYKKGSLKVSLFDGKSNIDTNEADLKEKLNTMNFYHFFKDV